MYKIFTLITLTLLLITQVAFSQNHQKVHTTFNNGDVVVSTTGRIFDGELDKSNTSYSDLVVGVYVEKTEVRNVPTFIESGIAYVKFDNSNGSVIKGDFITSSNILGTAMKAKNPGLMIGVAMEDSSGNTGLLKIRVQIAWVNKL